ncbi:MAG: TonB family protein [Betaproteobacteria bacterium]
MSAVLSSRYTPLRPTGGPRHAGAVIAIALHVVAGLILLSYEPTRTALMTAAPIMVELLKPPPPAPKVVEPPVELPKPQPVAVKPRPVAKATPTPTSKPAPAQPILVAPPTAPSPIAAPAQPAAPIAAVSTEGQRATLPTGGTTGSAGTAQTDPIFNADYLENPAPAYPSLSRRAREEGKVMLRVLVSPAGRADEVQVRASSGSPRLDEAARATVLRWKFVPAKRGSEAVAAWVLIPITFRLEG